MVWAVALKSSLARSADWTAGHARWGGRRLSIWHWSRGSRWSGALVRSAMVHAS